MERRWRRVIKIPDDIQQQIEETLRRPEGSITMRGEVEGLFDRAVPGGMVFDFVADPYVYRVERDANRQLLFYHSYPGTGTRVATIDLTKVKESPRVFWGFTSSKRLRCRSRADERRSARVHVMHGTNCTNRPYLALLRGRHGATLAKLRNIKCLTRTLVQGSGTLCCHHTGDAATVGPQRTVSGRL